MLAFGGGLASARPFSILASNHAFPSPPTTSQCLAAPPAGAGIACFNPSQFQQFYGTDKLYAKGITGAGSTIVIVDSFGSPTIAHDLAEFDTGNNLPAPPSLKIIAPVGPIPAYDPGNLTMGGWAIETSLDVEFAHAIAPGANILLVETPVAETEGVTGFPEMMQAEKYVLDHPNLYHATVISQSFGATEQTFPNRASLFALRYAYMDALRRHVTVVSGSGDGGATNYQVNGKDFYPFRVNSWPSTDELVTSVGGLQLLPNPNNPDEAPVGSQVWNDTALFGGPAASGGGVSEFFMRPWYQSSVASVTGDWRGTPDISLSAAVNGAANVYMSFVNTAQGITSPGYYLIGGTSEATPEFAGVVALAAQAARHSLGLLNPSLYAIGGNGPGITDVTAGNNSVSGTNSGDGQYPGPFSVTGFEAVPGYDLASGLGTVTDATTFVNRLAELSGRW